MLLIDALGTVDSAVGLQGRTSKSAVSGTIGLDLSVDLTVGWKLALQAITT